MKLEYLDATGNGEFPDASPARLIRLSQFNEEQKEYLMDTIRLLISSEKNIWLNELPFIDAVNCQLKLAISDSDEGISMLEKQGKFVCSLTSAYYEEMILIIKHVGTGHNWLTPGEYLDDPAFLITPFGTW